MSEFTQITISIKKNILEDLEKLAEKKGQKRTAIIRDALFEYLARAQPFVIMNTGNEYVDST